MYCIIYFITLFFIYNLFKISIHLKLQQILPWCIEILQFKIFFIFIINLKTLKKIINMMYIHIYIPFIILIISIFIVKYNLNKHE